MRSFLAPHDGEDLVPLFEGFIDRFGGTASARIAVAYMGRRSRLVPCPSGDRVGYARSRDRRLGARPRRARRPLAGLGGGLSRYVYTAREYRDLGTWVLTVAEVEATAREGLPLRMRSFQLWRARDGKVSCMRAFGSEADALGALKGA